MKTSIYQKIRLCFMTFSQILFPVTFYYLSPAIPLMGSALGIVTGSLVLFMMQMVLSVFAGRLFCSWLCPAGAIQDQIGTGRTKKVNPGKISWMKYVVWAVWLMILLLLFRRAGGISRVEIGFSTVNGVSTASFEALIAYTMVALSFAFLSLVFGRRAACHTICWMAPFMILGRRAALTFGIPTLQLKTDPDKCVKCGRCNDVCPMSLDVKNLAASGSIRDNNCILCGGCKDICPANVFVWGGIK